ncbi:methyltransferase domain-containing protein [Acidimangrovimonas sediminis]|uniref:methyltransferase domain-containing protein n=1 Tax=Acidimangrovimonas sediminis TaxID=2056283 RepID=UPI000C8100EF|nr:methyltransferase domain-containing protein [Acidimangrovimonas sediminis]
MAGSDWNPGLYARFEGLRLRPALDLVAQVGSLPPGPVVDLGCGAGVVGPVLAARYSDRPLIGVDASPAMLEKAEGSGVYAQLTQADIAAWQPDEAPALIFSNAALHWLPDHGALMPRLAGMLAPGGVLAVQMPRQYAAPSHRFLRDIAVHLFPEIFDFTDWVAPVAPAEEYWRMLAPLGAVTAWESDYVQRLAPAGAGHPVRHFTESTAMRPFLERLDPDAQDEFVAAYEEALSVAYPPLDDGGVLFPFRRVFFTLTV